MIDSIIGAGILVEVKDDLIFVVIVLLGCYNIAVTFGAGIDISSSLSLILPNCKVAKQSTICQSGHNR